jgi:kinesin family protein 13
MKAPLLKERLEESEKLMKEMTKTWEEKLKETEKIHKVRIFIITVHFSV